MDVTDDPVTASRRASRGQVSTRVLEYVTNHPGIVVFVNDVVEATGLTPAQVKQAIWGLRSKNPELAKEIEVIVSGSAWSYRPHRERRPVIERPSASPNAASTTVTNDAARRPLEEARRGANDGDRMRRRNDATTSTGKGRVFEQIGVADDGSADILIRDDDGAVWIAKRLNFRT